MSHSEYSRLVEKPFLQQKQEMQEALTQAKPPAFPVFAVLDEKRAVDAANCSLLIIFEKIRDDLCFL